MKKVPPTLQLDLTASITDVPQANNLSLFIAFVEAVSAGTRRVEALAGELAVEERTVHYYADFGRWLKFIETVTPGEFGLTANGLGFAESVPSRGRLFSAALFSKKLVQVVQELKRESLDGGAGPLDTQEACFQAVSRLTTLSESTARRRAGALAAMLHCAYKPSQVDWSTGALRPETGTALDFAGQSFLTAMAVRQFGVERTFEIAFPRQVHTFVLHRGRGLLPANWPRASYDVEGKRATWFGPVPVNPSTLKVAERGGRDLRRLVIVCAPYITLAAAMLTLRDTSRRAPIHITSDMYGLRMWHRDRELGDVIAVLERFAQALDLKVNHVPGHSGGSRLPQACIAPGFAGELMEILFALGIVRLKDTTYELATGFADELRDSDEGAPSIAERLAPLQARLQEFLRRE